jgi:hypothetical protein
VARALRESKNPEKFDMRKFGHSCGTPACAIGHYFARTDLQSEFVLSSRGSIATTAEPLEPLWIGMRGGHTAIRDHFGITEEQEDELFGDPIDDDDEENVFVRENAGCGNAQTAIEAAEYIERFCEHAKDEP